MSNLTVLYMSNCDRRRYVKVLFKWGLPAGGTAYCLGSSVQDCWYLYTLNPAERRGPRQLPDQTLEVLMTDLDTRVMQIFTQDCAASSADATQVHPIQTNFLTIIDGL